MRRWCEKVRDKELNNLPKMELNGENLIYLYKFTLTPTKETVRGKTLSRPRTYTQKETRKDVSSRNSIVPGNLSPTLHYFRNGIN